jgi:hypothetical protein
VFCFARVVGTSLFNPLKGDIDVFENEDGFRGLKQLIRLRGECDQMLWRVEKAPWRLASCQRLRRGGGQNVPACCGLCFPRCCNLGPQMLDRQGGLAHYLSQWSTPVLESILNKGIANPRG